MYTNQRFAPRVTEFTAIEDQEGSNMVMLKMKHPTLFIFHPGQYAFLRYRGVDRVWHPFTIASAPRSNTVEFYIEGMLLQELLFNRHLLFSLSAIVSFIG